MDCFGNIFHKKMRLLAHLGGIQRAQEVYNSKSLYCLEWQLRRELEEVLHHEELLWLQKSRKEWLSSGDRNTTFFYRKTITRRKKNQIIPIQDDSCQWLYNSDDIKKHVVEFFSALYTSDKSGSHPYALTSCFPPIDTDMLHMLQAPIDDNEVRSTIFNMKPLKVPGVDGLHAAFYQSQWSTVGPSVCSFIKNIFENKHIPREINRTLLVLIPKVANPLNLKMYRPISLCTVIYKTVTKLIANRLQTILSHVIGPHQTSFVPGRHIIENIVVGQEVIHSMRRKSGRRGYMAIKMDLEKAYDRLSWSFIFDTLNETGLPLELIQVTIECITTAQMNVL